MTPREFTEDLLPILAGRWKGMVRTPGKAPNSFSRKAADEANMYIWEALSGYTLEEVVAEAREVSGRIPCLPEGKSYHWLILQIRGSIAARYNAKTADLWNWRDECTLWQIIGDRVRRGSHYTEAEVAEMIGKFPTDPEREYAYETLCRHINDSRERSVSRGQCTEDEAEHIYRYPRQQIEFMIHDRNVWLERRKVAEECKGTFLAIAGLLE